MIKNSIIIPTAGRPHAIKLCIDSLLGNDVLSQDAEIIIVDNNTDDELSESLRIYCNLLYGKCKYIRENSLGLSAARHRGAEESKGEILTFIDDDVEVSARWLSEIQKTFTNPDVAMVGGPSIPNFTCSVPSWFWDYMIPTIYGGWMCGWLSLLDIGCNVSDIDPNYIWGLNFSIRKTLLYKLGGFHIDLVPKDFQRWQGDGETGLTNKVKAAGYRAEYRQDVLLFHLCGLDR